MRLVKSQPGEPIFTIALTPGILSNGCWTVPIIPLSRTCMLAATQRRPGRMTVPTITKASTFQRDSGVAAKTRSVERILFIASPAIGVPFREEDSS